MLSPVRVGLAADVERRSAYRTKLATENEDSITIGHVKSAAYWIAEILLRLPSDTLQAPAEDC